MSASRRGFLKKVTASGAGLSLLSLHQTAEAGDRLPKADFHFLHLTDMHVRRKRKGNEGYARCVEAVNRLKPAPDLILMGGDMVFDGNYTAKEEYIDQIDQYTSVSARLKVPYYHCIGNHDVLGWHPRRKVEATDPDLGKKLIMERLGMPKSYYSFNHKGWHFVVMDSIHPVSTDSGPSYVGKFGEEQLDWLRHDLGAHTGMHVVVMTHIAAFCHIGQQEADLQAKAMNHMVVADTRAFRHILERYKVKAVLQGHSHVPEDYYYNGIWYLTSQSVSAAWWGGNWKGFEPGYTVFSVKGDNLSWYRRTFAWEHHLEPEDTLERERIAAHEQFLRQQASLRQEEQRRAGS
jgi:3',5'-cyclic AMP phosphodiesterase CpdA